MPESMLPRAPFINSANAAFARRVGILLTSSLRSAFQVSYAACMRTQTPAPSPNSLPRRTATAGDTGLRSRKMSYRCWREMPRGCAISAFVLPVAGITSSRSKAPGCVGESAHPTGRWFYAIRSSGTLSTSAIFFKAAVVPFRRPLSKSEM
jgi:hypothetical protein